MQTLLDQSRLNELVTMLPGRARDQERLHHLHNLLEVRQFFISHPVVHALIQKCSQAQQIAALQVIAIGQGPIVFRLPEHLPNPLELLQRLLTQLVAVDEAYDSIGGLVGYHTTFLRLLQGETPPIPMKFFHPYGEDISLPTTRVRHLVKLGLENLPHMAEIYPVGGAGDRLSLRDERTGEPLPAALLEFGGHTLLEGLIEDLQAREALYAKLHGRQVVTPIVLMTSAEKNNDDHIHCVCESQKWFGRPRESFFIVTQCSVPMITSGGIWAMQAPLQLRMKPGGHGALWKLMEDQGAFDWLASQGRRAALLRQINNPIAGLDYGLLAFCGAGFSGSKAFGFSACHRVVGAAEGMDVLFERRTDGKYQYGISSVEYTDFAKYGIEDVPKESSGKYSQFPSNTNILFVDLQAVREIIRSYPTPGVLINLKHTTTYLDACGAQHEDFAGRLESSVQNVADHLTLISETSVEQPQQLSLPTYVTFGERSKTISVTKKQYVSGGSLLETPEGCYLDRLRQLRELLVDHCQFSCPAIPSEESYLLDGPTFHCHILPSLGPLYSIMSQKLRGGSLALRSELQLLLAELDVQELQVKGSLLVRAGRAGRVCLRDIRVENRGIDWDGENRFWQERIVRHEALEIDVADGGEFVAESMTFRGAHRIIVPTGMRVVATGKGIRREPIQGPTWSWDYRFSSDDQIVLAMR